MSILTLQKRRAANQLPSTTSLHDDHSWRRCREFRTKLAEGASITASAWGETPLHLALMNGVPKESIPDDWKPYTRARNQFGQLPIHQCLDQMMQDCNRNKRHAILNFEHIYTTLDALEHTHDNALFLEPDQRGRTPFLQLIVLARKLILLKNEINDALSEQELTQLGIKTLNLIRQRLATTMTLDPDNPLFQVLTEKHSFLDILSPEIKVSRFISYLSHQKSFCSAINYVQHISPQKAANFVRHLPKDPTLPTRFDRQLVTLFKATKSDEEWQDGLYCLKELPSSFSELPVHEQLRHFQGLIKEEQLRFCRGIKSAANRSLVPLAFELLLNPETDDDVITICCDVIEQFKYVTNPTQLEALHAIMQQPGARSLKTQVAILRAYTSIAVSSHQPDILNCAFELYQDCRTPQNATLLLDVMKVFLQCDFRCKRGDALLAYLHQNFLMTRRLTEAPINQLFVQLLAKTRNKTMLEEAYKATFDIAIFPDQSDYAERPAFTATNWSFVSPPAFLHSASWIRSHCLMRLAELSLEDEVPETALSGRSSPTTSIPPMAYFIPKDLALGAFMPGQVLTRSVGLRGYPDKSPAELIVSLLASPLGRPSLEVTSSWAHTDLVFSAQGAERLCTFGSRDAVTLLLKPPSGISWETHESCTIDYTDCDPCDNSRIETLLIPVVFRHDLTLLMNTPYETIDTLRDQMSTGMKSCCLQELQAAWISCHQIIDGEPFFNRIEFVDSTLVMQQASKLQRFSTTAKTLNPPGLWNYQCRVADKMIELKQQFDHADPSESIDLDTALGYPTLDSTEHPHLVDGLTFSTRGELPSETPQWALPVITESLSTYFRVPVRPHIEYFGSRTLLVIPLQLQQHGNPLHALFPMVSILLGTPYEAGYQSTRLPFPNDPHEDPNHRYFHGSQVVILDGPDHGITTFNKYYNYCPFGTFIPQPDHLSLTQIGSSFIHRLIQDIVISKRNADHRSGFTEPPTSLDSYADYYASDYGEGPQRFRAIAKPREMETTLKLARSQQRFMLAYPCESTAKDHYLALLRALHKKELGSYGSQHPTAIENPLLELVHHNDEWQIKVDMSLEAFTQLVQSNSTFFCGGFVINKDGVPILGYRKKRGLCGPGGFTSDYWDHRHMIEHDMIDEFGFTTPSQWEYLQRDDESHTDIFIVHEQDCGPLRLPQADDEFVQGSIRPYSLAEIRKHGLRQLPGWKAYFDNETAKIQHLIDELFPEQSSKIECSNTYSYLSQTLMVPDENWGCTQITLGSKIYRYSDQWPGQLRIKLEQYRDAVLNGTSSASDTLDGML